MAGGDNTQEQIAFKLLELVAEAEKKTLRGYESNTDRRWILNTYAECLQTVRTATS